ncbi:unnamed protein product [Coccothraustes coccothraustes]
MSTLFPLPATWNFCVCTDKTNECQLQNPVRQQEEDESTGYIVTGDQPSLQPPKQAQWGGANQTDPAALGC